ncbi:hypothetical protein [Streptomyces sp. NPDC058964]|uniref:hypothetical protein n=1 Tax=Streptomyces sp. NPDC058964 TaxID=3346681 RepID=UPI0036C5A9EA
MLDVRDRPSGTGRAATWAGGGGGEDVVPLRPPAPEDGPRVKAYREHVREGTLAPALLWWVTPLHGWAVLDGHDRAVASLAKRRTPPRVVLTRLPDERDRRRAADEATRGASGDRGGRPPAPPPRCRTAAGRAAAGVRGRHVLAAVRDGPHPLVPLPGGAAAWDALAGAAVFQCPGD